MGQKIREDKITALSQGGGFVQLASGAYLTIGGQQYVTSTALQVAIPSLAANNLYMVYAVVSGGIPSLVISQNVNSVGPAGYSSWKLVGAFYANGLSSVGFGSFANIEGPVQTDWIEQAPLAITAVSVNPTRPSTVNYETYRFRRKGDSMELFWSYHAASLSGAASGTGNYIFGFPANLTMHSTKLNFNNDSIIASRIGRYTAWSTSQSRNFIGSFYARTTSLMSAWSLAIGFNSSVIDAGYNPLTDVNNYELNCPAIPVNGWDNRALKDL